MVLNIISVCISAFSFLFALFAWVRNSKIEKNNSRYMETQTLIEQGALETQIRSAIYDTTKELVHLSIEANKNQNDEILQNAFEAIDEAYRNAYEDACAKYIDGKIDKERFKKLYQKEIQNLVEGVAEKEFYADNQSPYASTLKVYKEWFRQG